MPSVPPRRILGLLAAAAPLVLVAASLPVPATAAAPPLVDAGLSRSPELSETTRLADRRVVVTGDRGLGAGHRRRPLSGGRLPHPG